MKKQVLSILIIFVSAINIISAYSYYGGGFSLSDLLNEIDAQTMLLGVTFIVSFALINLALRRALKGKNDESNAAVPGIISFLLALLITWGINKTDFSFDMFFYNLGIPTDFIFTIAPLIILGALIFMVFKLGFGKALVFGGLFLFPATFFVYEKGFILFLSILFIIAGSIIWAKWPKEKKPKNPYSY